MADSNYYCGQREREPVRLRFTKSLTQSECIRFAQRFSITERQCITVALSQSVNLVRCYANR